MLKHKLKFLILCHLSNGKQSGYGLIKDIEEATGWKPSYGSVYPQLESLRKEGLVIFKEEGKRKLYTLTDKGKESVKEFHENHKQMVEQMKSNLKLMSHLLGFDDKRHDELIELFFSALNKGKQPFRGVMDSATTMKMKFWELYEAGLIKEKEQEINAAMDEATKKLNRILEKGRKVKR